MKYLSIYKDFISEQTATNVESETEAPMTVGKSFSIQDMQNKMKEYNTQKNKIRSVFANDKLEDNEIPNLLKDYLKDKNAQKFVFENEFSQLEADLCNISRQIRKNELSSKNLDKDLEQERGQVSVLEPNSKETSKMAASSIQREKEDLKKKIQNLKELALQKEQAKNKILSDYEDRILNLKKDLTTNK